MNNTQDKEEKPLTRAELVDAMKAFSRVAESLSKDRSETETQTEQEPVTQTLNG